MKYSHFDSNGVKVAVSPAVVPRQTDKKQSSADCALTSFRSYIFAEFAENVNNCENAIGWTEDEPGLVP